MRKSNAEEIRSEWFKDHIVVCSILDKGQWSSIDSPVTIIRWAKPGTGMYAVTYIIRGNYLYVSGDIGDAVYCWNSKIDLEFLAGLNLDYFASKCTASEEGRGYKSWDREQAEKNFIDNLKDHLVSLNELEDESKVTPEMIEKHLYDNGLYVSDMLEKCSTKQEFYSWISENGYDILGDAWYEYTFGETIDMRCEGHLIGLEMVWEQISKNKQK